MGGKGAVLIEFKTTKRISAAIRARTYGFDPVRLA
jgi:hypothetical protein